MSLQFKFFSIPLLDFSDVEEELNTFLRTVHVVTVHRELVCQEGRHYWAMALEYMARSEKMVTEGRKKEPAKQKVDYKEVLSPEDFAVYAKLRDWRKETADKEAVQLYNVFMNEQLAEESGVFIEKGTARTPGSRPDHRASEQRG